MLTAAFLCLPCVRNGRIIRMDESKVRDDKLATYIGVAIEALASTITMRLTFG
jgi:hypothetical protein